MKLMLTVLLAIPASAGERVNGYYKKNGTYVNSYERSSPNAYGWDNKSYAPSQPAYNPSYYQPTKNYGSEWTTPNPQRFNDSNPNNDYAPAKNYSPPAYKAPPLEFKPPTPVQPTRYNIDVDGAIESAQRAAAMNAETKRLDAAIEYQKQLLYDRKLMILNAYDTVLHRYPRSEETNYFLGFINDNQQYHIGEKDIKEILQEGKDSGQLK